MKMMKVIYAILLGSLLYGAYFFGTQQGNSDNHQPAEINYVSNENGNNLNNISNDQNKRTVTPPTRITSVEEATIKLFEESAPSVVYITTKAIRQNYWTRDITEIPAGSGSGFVWDKDGHVVTNYHVIKNASSFVVTLSDQTTYEAELIGAEPRKDLAILRIDAPGVKLRPIPVGTSSDLKVGQSVYAIGNPFGLDQSLTTGIISALGREIQSQAGIPIRDVIQTDAAINPGNSGGPLLDSSGRLIGVNTAIYSPSGAYAGIGFSVPADVVNWVVPDIIEYGEVRRPVIGVELVSEQQRAQAGIEGAMILNISPSGAADQAGLQGISRDAMGRNQLGDVITAVNGNKVINNVDLILALEKFNPGDEIDITFERNGQEDTVRLILGSSKDM